jgi:hypothetical protein
MHQRRTDSSSLRFASGVEVDGVAGDRQEFDAAIS